MSWLGELTEELGLRSATPRHRLHALRYRNLSDNIRRLCELSDDARQKRLGGWVMDRRYLASFVQRSLDLGQEIFFDASVLAPEHRLPCSAFDDLRSHLTALLSPRPSPAEEVRVTPLEEADGEVEGLAGAGPRLLADAARRLGIPLPLGFVISTPAPVETSEHPEPSVRVEALRSDIEGTLRELLPGGPPRAFLLFSAGSDTPAAVDGGRAATAAAIAEAWQRVVASEAEPVARERLRDPSAMSVVTCILEEGSVERGTLFTSEPEDPLAIRLEVSFGERVGTRRLERFPPEGQSAARVPDEYRPLVRMALALERLAGGPQAMAWARGPEGFTPLHARAVVLSGVVTSPGPRLADALKEHELAARSAGPVNVGGVAAGPLRHVRRGRDLEEAEDSSVLVVHEDASREIDSAQVRRAAALLVRDATAATAWTGSALEARLPLLTGLDSAVDELPDGARVTVDAHEGAVYKGIVRELVLHQLVGAAGGPEEEELRLLDSIIGAVGAAGPGRNAEAGHTVTLFELVGDAHSAAVASFRGVTTGAWGVPAGTPLVGTGWPGTLRVVEVGGRAGRGRWTPRLEARRLRCLPLRVLLGAFGDGERRHPSPSRAASGLAIVSEDGLTLHVESPEGSIVMDARLGEGPGLGSICLASGPGEGVASADTLRSLGFRVVQLGPFRAAWLRERAFEDARGALRGLSREIARSLRRAGDGTTRGAKGGVARGGAPAREVT